MESKVPEVEETMLSRIEAAEKLYFSMFPTESTEKFRRFLLYVVLVTVREDDGITSNKIQWKLNNEFAFEASDVEIAVNALSNPRIFNAISKFHLKRKRGDTGRQIIHLRLRKENQDLIEAWEASVLAEFPEYLEMNKS